MTFEIHSDITNRSMTIASRAMRKVLRRKRSILWAIFDWSVFFINALLLIPFDGEPFTLDAGTVISLLVEVMLLSVVSGSVQRHDRLQKHAGRHKGLSYRVRRGVLYRHYGGHHLHVPL